jgi:hypothetical protein
VLKFAAMMEWLKAHSFLATWMGPVIGIVGLVLNFTKKRGEFDFRAFTLYLTFFILTGVVLSPIVDDKTKENVRTIWVVCFFAILYNISSFDRTPSKSVDNSPSKAETPTRPRD